MFSKANMQDGTKYDFLKLKLSNDFKIPDNDQSKVIFGYNGVGKTSIYRYIRDYKGDDRIAFLDYIDERENFIKIKKKITVSADVLGINVLNNEISIILKEMDIKKQLVSNFKITKIATAAIYGDKIKKAQKDSFEGFDCTSEEMELLSNTLGDIPPLFLHENRTALTDINEFIIETNEYKDSIIFKSLVTLNDVVSVEDTLCPICESNYPNIKSKINERMSELNNRKSLIIENLRNNNLQPTEDNVSKLLDTMNLLTSENLIADWMICNGSVQRYNDIENNYQLLTRKIGERNVLMLDADILYNSLKTSEDRIKGDISRYFSIEENKIVFNDTDKSLTITLPRDVVTYSTGEMNLLSFLIKIYEFIGSDKTILILDDPVSSLDIINHYKIVYEIVKAANTGKTIIILTHSIEMINAINSQYSRDFDFYYIDEDKNELNIQEIPRRDDGKNILTLDRLLANDPNEIIKALIEKETSPFSDDVHKIFHYDGSFSTPNYPLISNDFLSNMIDSYAALSNVSFIHNSYNKVIYIAAIRVWIEKEIRSLLSHSATLLAEFDTKHTLVSKITVLLRRDGTTSASIPAYLNREQLMGKKVMLNQGIHYQSQVMPFAYALNISLQELNTEILAIKNMFT